MRIFKRISMVLVLLGLLGALGWTGWQAYKSFTNGQVLMETGLKNLAVTIAAQGEYTLDGAKLTQLFKQAMTQEPRWTGLALVSSDKGLYLFFGNGIKNLPLSGKLTPGMPIFPVWDGQAWRQNTGMLMLNNPLGYRLEGLFDFITNAELYQMTQMLALALAGLLGYTILVLLISRLGGNKKKQPKTPFDVVRSDPPLAPSSPTTVEPPLQLDLEQIADETLAGLPEMNTPPSPLEEEFTYQRPPIDVEEKPTAKAVPQESPSSDGPSLFSPGTSLSWASFFPKRLDYELERCASFSQDLCLVLFHGPFLDDNEVGYSEAGREIGRFFVYRDLSFELDKTTFAIVIPGQDLEKSMNQATEFLRRLEGKFPGKGFYAGLSSRSGRLISHPVLLQESRSSLEKARDGQERVVGFKADPDRYRAHLATGV